MKKLTKFQKQLTAVICLLVLAAVCFTIYAVRANRSEAEKPEPLYPFTDEEIQAIEDFDGKAVFSFRAKQGQADAKTAVYMHLADGYASVSGRITVKYGEALKDGRECVLSVNGKEYIPDSDSLFSVLEDGTPYASGARAYFNTALFGESLGAERDALEGFDLDGDRVNSAGRPYLYGPLERSDIKYIYVENKYDKLTFVPVDGVFYLADTEMDNSTAVVATLVAASRAPYAIGKVENPKELAAYGLDSDEHAEATLLMQDKKGEAYFIRIGSALKDGSGYYAWCHGKKSVYIMPPNIANYILVPKEKFLVANYGTALERREDVYRKLDDIVINLDGETIKAELMTDEEKANHAINYSWKITEPERFASESYGYALPNFGTMGDIFNALCALHTDVVVEADPDSAAFEKYGLDKPQRSYSWVFDGEVRCTVYISKPDADGSMYAYSVKEGLKSGRKITLGIGRVEEKDFPYMNCRLLDYLDSKLFTQYFDDMEKIEFTCKGSSYRIDIVRDAEGAPESAFLNGKDVDLDSCRRFYQNGILHCTILDEYDAEGGIPEEIFRISLTFKGKKDEFVFGRLSSVKAHCLANGKAQYVVEYPMLETMMSLAERLAAGEKIE